ncbi:insulinase family protein, partial [Robiginitalea sp.]|nr:insulinase family protein [Robiginitalea sp.]
MLEKVVAKFGPLQTPETPVRDSYTEEPAQDGEKRVTVSRVGDIQLVSALYHTPAGSHPDYAALSVLEDALTNEPAGRLYKALVEAQKASSVWSYIPFTKEPGFIYITVEVPSDKSADEAEAILVKTLEDLKTNPVTETEMNRAKANLSKQFDQIFRNSSYLGLYMSEYIGAGDWRLAFITRDRIENTNLDAVNAAATSYLIPSNRTIGRFIPTKTPERVNIPHTENLEALVGDYKGRQDLGTGESFDVTYENIQARLEQGQLSNGIAYGFIEKSNRGNNVVLSFSIRNGNVNTLMNKGVIPGFTADMLSMGTKNRNRQEIEDALSELKSSISFRGGNGNVYANISSTKENLMPTLELMADMLKNPSFDAKELETLKTEALAGIEESKSEPQAIALNRISELNNNYPKGHPNYAMSMEEEAEAIKALSIDDLKAFYNDFYGLGMSITVGVGTFDGDAVKSFMENEFSGFESKNPYARIEAPYHDNNVHQESIITPDKQNAMSFGIQAIKISE